MSIAEYNAARGYGITTALQPDGEDGSKDTGGALADGRDLQDFRTVRIETLNVTERQRQSGPPQTTVNGGHNQARVDRGPFADRAMVLRRRVDKRGDEIDTILEVQSPIIRRALQEVLEEYEYINLLAVPIKISKPYEALFHCRDGLRRYAVAPQRSEEEKAHLQLLVDFIKQNLGPVEQEWEQMVPKHMITFDLLWVLFRAGDDVIVRNDYFQQVLRVISYEFKSYNGALIFEVEAWRWGYSGSKFGPAQERLRIPAFSSARNTEQLPFFPVKQLPKPQQDELKTKLVARGQKWRRLVKCQHMQYNGPVWTDPNNVPFRYENARIMLDNDLHVQSDYKFADHLIGSNGVVSEDGNYDDDSGSESRDSDEDDEPPAQKIPEAWIRRKVVLRNVKCHEDSDEYVMASEHAWLCPARARGFSLASKTFGFFLVDEIKDIVFRDNAFQLLELNQELKEAIQALVSTHGAPELDSDDDLIDNKGKGIIMSLEGPPGSGKTLTAESIAELTHNPLYVISTSELGNSPYRAESALQEIFERARRWNAVLLLDEADQFLSKRTSDDVERNSYVTIFLRRLEYYQGILFLTSNRVEEFDPAFSSRIHLKVSFISPDESVRTSIWRNFLMNVKECRDWDGSVYERLGRDLQVNGREIKNLKKIARVIALHKKQPLTEQILRDVYALNYRSKITSELGPAQAGSAEPIRKDMKSPC